MPLQRFRGLLGARSRSKRPFRAALALCATGASIMVATQLPGVVPSLCAQTTACSYEHTYLGNLPKEKEPGWHQEAQGVSHDATHWYFSQNTFIRGNFSQRIPDLKLWRVPATRDLSDDVSCGSSGVSCLTLRSTPASGYDHLGDITWHDGFLFVPLTGPDPTGFTPPAIAVFRGDETLAYVDHIALPQTVSFWIAVDKDGFLYSSDRIPDTKTDVPFTKYQIDWTRLKTEGRLQVIGGPWTVSLLDEAGQPLQLVDMQGGAFSTDGTLLYITNGLDDDCDCGIHVFDVRFESSDLACGTGPGPCTARRVDRSTNGSGRFNFEYHPGWPYYQEPEGITYWDLDAPDAPQTTGTTSLGVPLGGQVHALLLDNDLDDDDVYLKHYRARVSCEPPLLLSVTPDAIDFGDVPQGGSKTQDVRIVNASNVSLTIQAAALRAASDTDFTLSAVPALPFSVAPGAAVEFEVTYTPTSVGEAAGELEISGDIAGGVEVIVLAGSGISYEQQISNLVSAFDEAVAAGDLRGSGAGTSANERLQALRNMLVRAGDLVEAGSISQACVQLADALARTDGRVPPADFVTGGAASELAAEIVALRTRLGCP